jgi:hypothetical protein
MYKILFDGGVIGTSQLEAGDAPMGCAHGIFFPASVFEEFKAAVPCEQDDDPVMKRWVGLSVSTADDQLIRCHDVVLFEANLGSELELELEVDVIGVDADLYQQLFPQHVLAYENQFR